MSNSLSDFNFCARRCRNATRGAGRSLMLISAGVLFAAAFIVVLFNMESTGNIPAETPPDFDDMDSLIEQMDQVRINDLTESEQSNLGTADPNLLQGGLVQYFDENNRLEQRLRAQRFIPQANNTYEAWEPEIEQHLKDGRIVLLEGRRGNLVVRRDSSAKQNSTRIETGRLNENVIIRLYEPPVEGGEIDLRLDKPKVLVHASEAEFDNTRGQIRCNGTFNVQTQSVDYSGAGLEALYDRETGLQSLTVDRATRELRISMATVQPVDTAPTQSASPSDPETAGDTPTLGPRDDSSTPAPTLDRRTDTPRGNTEVASNRDRSAREPRVRAADGGSEQPRPQEMTRAERRAADTPDWLAERRRRAAERAGESSTAQSSQPAFYRAVFHDNVRIYRYDGRQLVESDQMEVVFSMENSGLDDSLASGRRLQSFGALGPGSPLPPQMFALARAQDAIALMAIAAFGQDESSVASKVPDIVSPPAADDVYIAYDGPLTILPLRDDALHLATKDDVYLKLIGDPIRITDSDRKAVATCATVEYVTSEETLVLLASPTHEVWLRAPEVVAAGRQLNYSVNARVANFVHAGVMHLTNAKQFPDLKPDAEPGFEPQIGGLDIAWQDGVQLEFAAPRRTDATDGRGGERLREATFDGEVVVNEQRFNLTTDQLRVAFDQSEDAKSDDIAEIEADGSVVVLGLDTKGGLANADHLLVHFAKDTDRPTARSQPRTIFLTGNAHAEDDTQSIWANRIEVDLVEATTRQTQPVSGAVAADEVVVDSTATEAADDTRFDRMEIRELRAFDDVMIALPNGSKATGDTLVANARTETADLTGEHVVIDGSEDDVDFHAEGSHVHVARVEGITSVTMKGAGTANVADLARGAVQVQGQQPSEEMPVIGPDPTIDEGAANIADTVNIDVSWSQDLVYRFANPEDPAYLDITGDVHAESTSTNETNSIDCYTLGLTFGDERVMVTEADGHQRETTRRVLRRMLAKGDAALENRVWEVRRFEGQPRVTHIKGGFVEYNQMTFESRVVGPGVLLIADPREAETEAAQSKEKSIAGRGITLFEWTDGMQMRQLVDERYQVGMQGDVRMVHTDLQQANTTLTTRTLDVELARRAAENHQGGLDFGGSTDITRFTAIGDVLVDTPDRMIECNTLNYNETTQIAEIIGSANSDASILVKGAVAATRAEKMIWDLQSDRVQVTNIRGSIPRGNSGGGN